MTRPPHAGRLGAVLLGPAVLLAAVAAFGLTRRTAASEGYLDPSQVVAPAPAASPLTTPILGWRRVPAVVARDVNVAALTATVDQLAPTLGSSSCLAVGVDGMAAGQVNATAALIPASNQKVVTAHGALAVLGPDHQFVTAVRGPAPVGGVVTGDVFLVGGGDPLLTSDAFPAERRGREPVTTPTSFDGLVEGLVNAGVTRIEGRVVGDGSRYDDERFVPSWPQGIRDAEAGPIGALMVNDADDGGGGRVADPAAGAARELVRLLESRGIAVSGGSDVGVAPADAPVLASVTSVPMIQVVAEMLTTSDDNTAEMLVKEIGVVASGQGTRLAGLAAIQASLTQAGIPTDGLVLDDGSGLSRANFVSCATLLAVLGRHSAIDPLGAGLPVAGRSGTLAEAFVGSAVEGRLQAKTGTLCNPPAAKGLSGYLPTGAGTISFALLLNGDSSLCETFAAVWDDAVDALATYPAGPSIEQLGPR